MPPYCRPKTKILFHSFLSPQIQNYIKFRRALGFVVNRSTFCIFRDFDYYVLCKGVHHFKQIDEILIANWIHAIKKHSNGSKNDRLSKIRSFLRYLMRLDLLKQDPTERLPHLKMTHPKPYIYSLKEIHQILQQARNLQCRYPKHFSGWTLETLFFLIYACGLRLGEALRLNIQDVDFEEETLSLWKTKFHKERIVPFSKSVAQKLKFYLKLRRLRYPPSSPEDPFFCHAGGRYHNGSIEFHFRNLLARSGLTQSINHYRNPRIHELRHAFAIHRLYKWYQEGHDILNKLPLLSTYMGHAI